MNLAEYLKAECPLGCRPGICDKDGPCVLIELTEEKEKAMKRKKKDFVAVDAERARNGRAPGPPLQNEKRRAKAVKKWMKAIEERDRWTDERKRTERLVLHAALQIGDWRAPDGYAHWAEELNRCVKALRYAMEVEQSHTDEVSLRAQEIKP